MEVRSKNTYSDRTVNSADGRAKERVRPRSLGASEGSYPPIDPLFASELRAYFREENLALADWLGRDLSAWNDSIDA